MRGLQYKCCLRIHFSLLHPNFYGVDNRVEAWIYLKSKKWKRKLWNKVTMQKIKLQLQDTKTNHEIKVVIMKSKKTLRYKVAIVMIKITWRFKVMITINGHNYEIWSCDCEIQNHKVRFKVRIMRNKFTIVIYEVTWDQKSHCKIQLHLQESMSQL